MKQVQFFLKSGQTVPAVISDNDAQKLITEPAAHLFDDTQRIDCFENLESAPDKPVAVFRFNGSELSAVGITK